MPYKGGCLTLQRLPPVLQTGMLIAKHLSSGSGAAVALDPVSC